MATTLGGLQEVSHEVNSKGVLVVHGCPGGDEVYEITKIPPATAFLVQGEKKNILRDLGLQTVLTDLNRASDLLFLAYLGLVGTGALHARIGSRQIELADLCGECVLTMDALTKASLSVLDRLTEAYSYLLEANEPRALHILSRCADDAGEMSTKCGKLADGFGKLKDDTKDDAAATTNAWGNQVAKLQELQKLRDQMQATTARLEKSMAEFNNEIEALKADITKEEAREDRADTRAWISGIVGAIAGGVGGGLGAFAMKPIIFGANFQPGSSVPEAGGQGGSGNAKQPSREQQKPEKEKANATKSLEDAKTAEAKARGKKRDVDRKVFDADADRKTKQSMLDTAKAANPAVEAKVREAQTALDASAAILAQFLVDQQQAQEDLVKATKETTDAREALKAAMDKIAEAASQVAKEQAERAKILTNSRLTMVRRKYEIETLRRDAIGQLAELTSRLESSTRETNVEESAQTALEIATWALHNISASLSNAKFFWDSMQSFCKDLSNPKVIEQIKDETKFGSTREERIQFYMSRRFVTIAITYIAKWAALASVCGEYVVASERARRSVLGHIRASPNAEEARKLIEPLKKQLQDEFGADAVEGNLKIKDLEDEARELEAAAASKPNADA